MKIPSASNRSQNTRVLAICVLAIIAITAIDYFTGVQARVYPLYYLPIAFGAWRVSKRVGILLALLSTALWLLAMSLDGPGWALGIYVVNAITQAVSFLLVSLLVSNISMRLKRESELSQTDALTSLKNGRAFRDMGEFVVSSAQRSERPLTMAYLDLDNLKALNDKFGHQVGDQSLQMVGLALRTQTRKSDLVARMGGDEFAILLPDTDQNAATMLLERVALSISRDMSARGWPTTVSIGACVFLQAPDSLAAAIADADAVVYRAKGTGKNRVLVESTSGQTPAAHQRVEALPAESESGDEDAGSSRS